MTSTDLRRHLDWLLEQLGPLAPTLETLSRRGLTGDIFCYWRSKYGHGGPTLSRPQLGALAALDLEIGFDVYGLTPGGNQVAGLPDPAEQRHEVALTPHERALLQRGLAEWGGPTRCTEEMAIALGFPSVPELYSGAKRLRGALADHHPLTAVDWARVFTATEVVFASDLVGSGLEWSITTGYTDHETLDLLRSAQRKLPAEVFSVIRNGFGIRPHLEPVPARGRRGRG